MKDVVGNELKVGQQVVTNVNGYLYSLCVAEILGITPHKVKLKSSVEEDIFYKFPEQVAVVKREEQI